jgi:hypothetical protein
MAHGYRLRDEDVSPDGRFGVIHADADTIAPAKARNYLVALGPFRILGESKGAVYHQPNDGHGAIVVEWAKDNTAALVMVGHKWGTIGATLFELKEGRVTRRTDLYAKLYKGLMVAIFGIRSRYSCLASLLSFSSSSSERSLALMTRNRPFFLS